MCTLYNIKTTRAEINAYFQAEDGRLEDIEKDYVATNRPGWVIAEVSGERLLTVMKWGFPPPPSAKGPVVNVRNLTSPFWRTALSKPERRCLVAVTEFSEWSAKSAVTGKATLHWFSIPSRPIFAMAGLWRSTESGPAYAFLTSEPNPLVCAIHPKPMPVILHEEDHDRWLRGSFADACELAQPYPSQLMAISSGGWEARATQALAVVCRLSVSFPSARRADGRHAPIQAIQLKSVGARKQTFIQQ